MSSEKKAEVHWAGDQSDYEDSQIGNYRGPVAAIKPGGPFQIGGWAKWVCGKSWISFELRHHLPKEKWGENISTDAGTWEVDWCEECRKHAEGLDDN